MPRTKPGLGRALPGAGLVALFAVIVVVLVANVSRAPRERPRLNELPVPAALAGAPIVTSLRGPAALAEVSRLHGKTIEVVDAAVARYRDGSTIWISASSSALDASRLFWRMNRRMANGTQVFSTPRPQEVGGRPVFVTEGIGQVHYYYQSGARVIWLAVPPGPHAGSAVEALLRLYP